MAEPSGVSPADSNTHRDDGRYVALEPKHKVFLSHSGAEKAFAENLCEELERCFRYPFFDIREDSLPIGENFPKHIFDAIRQCYVGVVILSEEFFTSKWPMMELVAMVEEVEKRKSSFKIIPVFFRTSLAEFEDVGNRSRWRSYWDDLALKYPKRVIVEKWEASLEYLRTLNGLVYNDGIRESRFMKVIVDAICGIVPQEIRLEDSHIQGRERLCKVIQDKIDVERKDKVDGVCVVGLYGTGGMGKTTICKALCNEVFLEFRGRVCHAELERASKEELLRDVVKRLSNISHERLNGFNQDELLNGLKEGKFIKEAVFLALDNMSDTNGSIKEAKSYLSARLPLGSIVMVTTRSKESLARLRPYLDESGCIKMPELEIEEAKSLFVKSSEGRHEDDEQLILRCVQRCRFRRDDNTESYHYHPLALDVLGRELAQFMDAKEWRAQLDMIDKDIFNLSKEKDHPIFSILRKSFDALSHEDQLLFMDVALYLPYGLNGESIGFNLFDWLAMVHRFPRIDDVMEGLERLRRKSLLERFGNEGIRSIGMHDLWRAFCVAETKSGELRGRRWVYKEKLTCSELVESSPSGKCWENVKRMAFVDNALRSLERVDFGHFSNVTVLKIYASNVKEKVVVDLSGLVHLKSLEISGSGANLFIVQGLPRGLNFLSSVAHSFGSSFEELVNQIGGLSELHYLRMTNNGVGELPDMKSMILIRRALFCNCVKVVTVTGLSSKLTNLRVLDFLGCRELRSCPGVGDLVNLEELNCSFCNKLERLPNLGKLRRLRKLDISWCGLINEVPGLGDLVALEKVCARRCFKLSKLPDMQKLINLRVLDLFLCPLVTGVQGLDCLISLHKVVADLGAVEDRPNLTRLTKLEELEINGCSAAEILGLGNLVMLHSLKIGRCSGVDELPDFGSLIRLQTLRVEDCELTDVSGLSSLSALESLRIWGCRMLERLPDLQGLSMLKSLEIGCCGLADLTSIGAFSLLEELEIEFLPVSELPDLSNFPRLKTLRLRNCKRLRRLMSRVPVNALSEVELVGCSSLATLPDLCNNFPGLRNLKLQRFDAKSRLSRCGPLTALTRLNVSFCNTLKTLPDLGSFPALQRLSITGCSMLTMLSSSAPLAALQELELVGCSSLAALPDLCNNFPGLLELKLKRFDAISRLSSSGPLTALTRLDVSFCDTLETLPDLGSFPALQRLSIKGCSKLTMLSSSAPLAALRELELVGCSSLATLPDLCNNFPGLLELKLQGFDAISRLSRFGPLTALTRLDVSFCDTLETLPDLGSFPALQRLSINGCSKLMALSSSAPLAATRKLKLVGCSSLATLPDLCNNFPGLLELKLERFDAISRLSRCGPLTALTRLDVFFGDTLEAVPDLGSFPALQRLSIKGCSKLTMLSSSAPLTALEYLKLVDCGSLATLPDLCNYFPELRKLRLERCDGIITLSSSAPLTALTTLEVRSCISLTALPDLGMFLALRTGNFYGCCKLMALSSSVPLTALQTVDARGCRSLSRDDLDQLRASCPQCEIVYEDEAVDYSGWLFRLLGFCGGMIT